MGNMKDNTNNKRNPGAIEYFHRRIYDFDSIYEPDQGGVWGFLNRTLRASVRRRFDLAFELLGDLSGKSVLDIGCGSGRYMFEAVRRGATEVVGLDAAAGAIEAAARIAGELGMREKNQFIQADFLDYQYPHRFNVAFAVGYFDYILQPEPHLKKMLAACDGSLYMSFPRRWHIMTPIRKARLALNHCPVRFYSRSQIRKLMADAGHSDYRIIDVARDYIVIAKIS